MKKHYLPKDFKSYVAWLKHFGEKLPLYANKYGIAVTEVTRIAEAAAWAQFLLNLRTQTDDFSQALTAFTAEFRKGADQTDFILPTFLMPAIGTEPQANTDAVIASLAARIKKHPNYKVSDGEAMGIEGITVVRDAETARPDVRVSFVEGFPKFTLRNKGQFSAVALYRWYEGDDAPQFLKTFTRATYTDSSSPLPAYRELETRRYVFMFVQNDKEVGEATELEVIVKGRPS